MFFLRSLYYPPSLHLMELTPRRRTLKIRWQRCDVSVHLPGRDVSWGVAHMSASKATLSTPVNHIESETNWPPRRQGRPRVGRAATSRQFLLARGGAAFQ